MEENIDECDYSDDENENNKRLRRAFIHERNEYNMFTQHKQYKRVPLISEIQNSIHTHQEYQRSNSLPIIENEYFTFQYEKEEENSLQNINYNSSELESEFPKNQSLLLDLLLKGDSYEVKNKSCEGFNIFSKVMELIQKLNEFQYPNDNDHKVYVGSNITIGEFMRLFNKTMIYQQQTTIDTEEIFKMHKLTLPMDSLLHSKCSADSKLYDHPISIIKVDICPMKGCEVFVGTNSNSQQCFQCKSNRFRSCSKKSCHQQNNCLHIRPVMKQVKNIINK
jgi:hypothetical protein